MSKKKKSKLDKKLDKAMGVISFPTTITWRGKEFKGIAAMYPNNSKN